MRTDLYVSMRRSGIDPGTLKEQHRIILCTDGTVTDILEAYHRERMTVVTLHQDVVPAQDLSRAQLTALGLDATPASEVLKREILLRGEVSESCHLHATSVIVLDRLSEPVRQGLLDKKQPIGHLLLEQRIATFKEIIDCHRDPAGALATHFAISDRAPMLSRTYVISVEARPLMMITEKFPEFGR
ncbi:MAG TPA: chorismate pyruvate-lyase family protein [Kofleriaceae bacterium]